MAGFVDEEKVEELLSTLRVGINEIAGASGGGQQEGTLASGTEFCSCCNSLVEVLLQVVAKKRNEHTLI